MTTWRILLGDVREQLRTLPAESVQTCVTSPPYWGLRDYGHEGQIGLERTPAEYVAALVGVFQDVRRALKDDGVLWLNLGDCYATGAGKVGECPGGGEQGDRWKSQNPGLSGYRGGPAESPKHAGRSQVPDAKNPGAGIPTYQPNRMPLPGLKPKDLVGIPWRVAFALQADGWYLRSDIIWHKPNPMPESVTDRPTKAHEYIFLLSKSERYFYNADAIAEPVSAAMLDQMEQGYDGTATKDYDAAGVQNPSSVKARIIAKARDNFARQTKEAAVPGQALKQHRLEREPTFARPTRNRRSVWTFATQPYPDAHFATYPEDLIEPCILAGSREGDTVLDPFTGSGTTGAVAVRHQRSFIGVELNPAYLALARKRIGAVAPLFASEVA